MTLEDKNIGEGLPKVWGVRFYIKGIRTYVKQ